MTFTAGRVFLLSPANCNGRRAKQVLSPRASFQLADELRSTGAALGDLFAFVSGLYFRGKLTYARRFAAAPDPGGTISGGGIHVITPNAGLRNPDTLVTAAGLQAFAGSDIHQDNAAFRRPLERSARTLLDEIGSETDVVLLGSVASPKYTQILLDIFGARLLFPIDFVGRGDMSRGGLLLRMAAAGTELEYAPVSGTVLRGRRPPKLPPLRRTL